MLAGYSRLVIDCNRRLDDPDLDRPGKRPYPRAGQSRTPAEDRKARQDALFRPYHAAITDVIARKRKEGPYPAILSLHSFTPQMNGFARPWHIGILWNRDPRLPVPLMARLLRERGWWSATMSPIAARTSTAIR